MPKMSPIPSVPISLHIQAGRIPVHWSVREGSYPEVRDVDGRVIEKGGIERVFWPKVIQHHGVVELNEIENPLDLRVQLFKMFNTNRTEDAALDFLNKVGAWQAVIEQTHESWAEGTHASVAYRHRFAVGLRVVPITLSDLFRDTERWYALLGVRNSLKFKAEFKQPPRTDSRPGDWFAYAGDAYFSNTLPVSLEWHGKDPYAVIETITASELMIAAAWSDVVSRAEEQVCYRCGTRFSWPRKKKYCQWECGHLNAVRKYKRKKALERRKNRKGARESLRPKSPRLRMLG